jgi:hypothetical protein
MTPAFTTKCLVRTCSPNKHGWRRPVKTVDVATVNVSIRDHETDRGRRSLARQRFRPREVKASPATAGSWSDSRVSPLSAGSCNTSQWPSGAARNGYVSMRPTAAVRPRPYTAIQRTVPVRKRTFAWDTVERPGRRKLATQPGGPAPHPPGNI